ncbi:fused MFS/spermidine synthase [Tautonia plasticadhaerens]|uniref:Spermidine synthase n=1 Tax=Tautonia plasticadhaerens TaxID=2527974 RepID=A0A518H7H5_9BACT|nr:fused MFS/spermidine synthase [Tautonia plasticadhaerens]QDV36793.1 spermidine synthase [Tautonia plasticadhaerens]
MSTTGRTLARSLPYALAFFASLCIMTLELVASRLVARHVGASLHVWTSVIGVVLGGICLGNFLGGRLADRTDARRAIGPLFALGAALTLGSLWVNAVVGETPGLDAMPWSLRTLLVVSLDFLVPATVLGLIGPVVATVAVEQAKKTGSAIGDVYFWGAIGSIVGTFLAGFVLMYQAPTSVIVTVVAAALLVPAAGLLDARLGGLVALLGAVCLGAGSVSTIDRALPGLPFEVGSTASNPLVLAGHGLAAVAGLVGLARLWAARRPRASSPPGGTRADDGRPTRLSDLAALAFLISLAFMTLEMVAGRMATRHLGSSIFGWTSIIGVMLGGLSLGNLIGGKLADRISGEKQASWLFLAASAMVLLILFLETPPAFLGEEWAGASVLSYTPMLTGMPWSLRVLAVVALVFFLPSITMGTVSPVVTKLAIDRLRRVDRTGTAIGSVYAWGMVGSIAGTFLAGFLLIDVLGTKGLILGISTAMALAATGLGGIGHAAWAGIPLGLTFIALAPLPALQRQGVAWGVRNVRGDPGTESGIAHLDESNYYYIKVESEVMDLPSPGTEASSGEADAPPDALKRTLVLDNLIHGYFVLGHPEHIEYDYEFIYAQVARRVAEQKAERLGIDDPTRVPLRALFLGGGSYTFPRYLQHAFPNAECDVAEIDPAVTEANHVALGLPRDTPIRTHWGDARQFVERAQGGEPYDLVFGDAFNDFSVPWHLTTREFNELIAGLLDEHGAYLINIIDVYRADDVAVEEAAEEAQIEAVAAVFREAGNDADSADSIARGLRTAWNGDGLGLRPSAIAEAVSGTLAGVESRDAGPIAAALRRRIAELEDRFRGGPEELARLSQETLERAQSQRDQAAASEALAETLELKKARAATAILRDGGLGGESEEVAEAIADVWYGDPDVVAGLLEVAAPQSDADGMAERIDASFRELESDLRESPSLLSFRLVHPMGKEAKATGSRDPRALTSQGIAGTLREVGVRRGVDDYASAVSTEIKEREIRGDLEDLARRAARAATDLGSDPDRLARDAARGVAEARGLGAFIGSWTGTAGQTFREVEVFGTDAPGAGFRETFVVVASEAPIDLADLGRRPDDPTFEQDGEPFEPDPYPSEDRAALRLRSRGITLTDDYAPVENLLAPVAATRATD